MSSLSPEWKHEKTSQSNSNRKIYNRDDFFRYYNCSGDVPDYLKEFQYLYNNYTEENWCTKPIPKFEEIPETKGKSIYPINKSKGRQRTLSNQSGDNSVDSSENNNKQRSYNSNGKFNRYGTSPNEALLNEDIKIEPSSKFIDSNDFIDNEAQWHKVDSKVNRYNSTKPYAQNIQLAENHWKKWTKDSNQTTDKNRPLNLNFNRQERSNIWVRKNETENRQRNSKSYGRHSVSKSGDQTEDIWQEDWETEMKLEIGKDDDLLLDNYEFPKSSVLSTSPPSFEMESKIKSPTFEVSTEPIKTLFDLWFYRDLSDIERGPFSSENMANWLATGYFNPSTFVRRSCDDKFLLLAEYRALYGRIPFTAGPAVPPIHMNTPIDIDLKQLLIGVDINLIPKVISGASSLPKIVQSKIQQNNVAREEEKMNTNAVEMMAILEQKRILEESRAELERERERMVQDQVQWRERMEAELKVKIEEIISQKSLNSSDNIIEKAIVISEQEILLNKSIDIEDNNNYESKIVIGDKVVEKCEKIPNATITTTNDHRDMTEHLILSTPPIKIEDDKPMISITSNMDKWEIDEANLSQAINIQEPTNSWFSTKDTRQQKKNKKNKMKETNISKTDKDMPMPTTIISELKHPEQPSDTRISFVTRESISKKNQQEIVVETKGRPIRFELDNRVEPIPVKNNVAQVSSNKTILDIQAEEFANEKKEKESQKQIVELENAKSTTRTSKTTTSSIWGQKSKSIIRESQTEQLSILKIQAEEVESEMKEKLLLKSPENPDNKIKEMETRKLAEEQTKELQKAASFKETANKKTTEHLKKDSHKPAILVEMEANKITGKPSKLEFDNRKTEQHISWNAPVISPNSSTPIVTKSLLEIQAEEAIKEQRQRELLKSAKAYESEANKVTSFKESLLKSTKLLKTPVLPVGKSIWDMLPAENTVVKLPVQTPESVGKKNVKIVPEVKNAKSNVKESTLKNNINNQSDHLSSWCIKKLAKFSDKFDVSTVIELLIQVPNEEVMELAVQLLDDSKFISSFVVEFINKRQELSDMLSGDSWQTVKKPIIPTTTPMIQNSNNKNKNSKSKSKKKMVVVDTKFR